MLAVLEPHFSNGRTVCWRHCCGDSSQQWWLDSGVCYYLGGWASNQSSPLCALFNGLSLSWGHCAADLASNSIQWQADKCQSLTNLIMDAEKLIQKYWNCFYSIWFLYKNEILNFKKKKHNKVPKLPKPVWFSHFRVILDLSTTDKKQRTYKIIINL